MTNQDGVRARGIIAGIAVVALVAISILLCFFEPPKGSRDVLLIVVGALVAFCADVKQFYFGSSSGAKVMVQNAQEVTKAAVQAVANSVPAPGATVIDDPRFPEFRRSMLAIDKTLSEEAILQAWKEQREARP